MLSCVINNFPKYTIYEDGTILNHVDMRIMSKTTSRNRSVVQLTNSPDKQVRDISLLVANHFLHNDDPENKTIIIHKDKNYSNHHLSNLKWERKGEDVRQYTPEEAHTRRKISFAKCRDRRNDLGLVKPEQRKWRQSLEGHFIRNRNHWIAANIKEPLEGWREFYFNTFIPATHCELCHVEFIKVQNNMSQKCLEHDHMSGYIRSICCRKCNSGVVRKTDFDMKFVLLELHRYFNR